MTNPPLNQAQQAALARLRTVNSRRRVAGGGPNQEASKMKVDRAVLAKRLALPVNATEPQILAALATPPTTAPSTRAPARRAAPSAGRPRLTASAVSAMSSPDLSHALNQMGWLTPEEKALIDEETAHRTFMALNFPDAARAAGYPKARPDLTSRSGAPLKGLSE